MTLRSPVKIMGGKSASANLIVDAFPPPVSYDLYVEPFGGAAHVLMAKPVTCREVFNDLDNLLINFWQEVQVNGQEVQRQLEALPYARKLYYDFWHSLYGSKMKKIAPDTTLSSTEKAVRWLYILRSNMTGFMRNSPPSWTYMNASILKNAAALITEVQQRIKYVAIDNRDAIETVKRYEKIPGRRLFYIDPPYFEAEWYYPASRDGFDHEGLAQTLNVLSPETSMVALSYYPHPLIDALYPASKWRRITWQQHKPSNVGENSTSLDMATEMLLCNYPEPTRSLWDWESKF